MMAGGKVAGPEAQMVGRAETGGEEGDAADMVVMRMAAQDFGRDRFLGGGKRSAQSPQPGAGIEDQQVLAAPNLDAGRIATIADCVRPGAGNASPNSPELDLHFFQISQPAIPQLGPGSRYNVTRAAGKWIMQCSQSTPPNL